MANNSAAEKGTWGAEVYLTPKQAAARLGGISSRTVIRLVDAGLLAGTLNVGEGQIRRRGLRIPEAAVLAYLAQCRVEARNEVA